MRNQEQMAPSRAACRYGIEVNAPTGEPKQCVKTSTAEGRGEQLPQRFDACVVLMGPSTRAVSGVSTHIRQLSGSALRESIKFLHFQVGSEGRAVNTALRTAVRFLFGPVAFGSFLMRHRPDVVHINTSLVLKSFWRDLLFLVVAKLFRCKVVYQIHGGALPQQFFAGNALLTELLRKVLESVDAVVLLARSELLAYEAFAPSVRFELVANGIDPARLMREPLRTVSSGPLRLAYVGRLAAEKGLFEALDALALLASEGREVSLTIAGQGPDESRLIAKAKEMNLSDRVRFAGPVYDEAKEEVLRAAQVFTLPTYAEGLPYALLEAMAAGAVPVATPVGAIPDVLEDGVHGLLVSAKDSAALAAAIRRLDDDRQLLAEMAVAGRARILERYTATRVASDFGRLYSSLLCGH